LFTCQSDSPDVPARAVTGLLARGQTLLYTEQPDDGELQETTVVIAIPKRTSSDGVDRNPLDPISRKGLWDASGADRSYN
jgi:hypothetical protein